MEVFNNNFCDEQLNSIKHSQQCSGNLEQIYFLFQFKSIVINVQNTVYEFEPSFCTVVNTIIITTTSFLRSS